jgi:competence protein ComEC
LVYGQISYLLTSDIESFTEHYLVRHSPKLESTVLKVGHHGSLTSTTAPFLERVSPELAVISVGDGNHFGHPHPEVMDRLKQTLDPGRLFRTDRDGRVEFISDGVSLWVNTEEEQP